ncbi:MAG: hypothetical protein Q9171_001673 [Xanthocarpia ochracea]
MAGMSQEQILYQTQHINDDRSSHILGTAISMAILSVLAVLARFACRRKRRVAISYDDYMIVAGLLLYGSGITAIKLSILLFYLRLFPKETTSRRWRASLYTIAAVLIFYLTAGAPVTVFQCRPIAYAWIRKGKGSCNDQLAFLYFSQAYMIATDIIILCLPIPVVWRLHLRKGKKIGVLAIFLLGSFVCITSIVRFFYVGQIVPFDATWTQVNVTIWSTVEPSTGILSACLPIMGPLLRIKMTNVRSLSWFGRSSSGSPRDGCAAAGRPIDLQMPEKALSRETSAGDEEMATAPREVQPVGKD